MSNSQPNDAPQSSPTRIRYEDGTVQEYLQEVRFEFFDGSSYATGPRDDSPLANTPQSLSRDLVAAGNNLFVMMLQNDRPRGLAEGFYRFFLRNRGSEQAILSEFESANGHHPIEFAGLPYGSWHAALVSAYQDALKILDRFYKHWSHLAKEVTWYEFLDIQGGVIDEHWKEVRDLLNQELDWDAGDLHRACLYARFEAKRMPRKNCEPPVMPDDQFTPTWLAALAKHLSPNFAPSLKRIRNWLCENGKVIGVIRREDGYNENAYSYGAELLKMREMWEEIPFPESYEEAEAQVSKWESFPE